MQITKRKGWQKGQSGNPKGRKPKEWTWTGLLKEALEKRTGDGKQYKQRVAEVLIERALEGDVQAIKELGNRLEGLPDQRVEHKGDIKIIPILQGVTKALDVSTNDGHPEAIEADLEN